MNITEKFFETNFSHEESKKAYLAACKWIAVNIISKVEVSESVTFSIKKDSNADLPTFKIELYCSINESDLQKKFCDRCKEYHKSFFINQEYNCGTCKARAYIDGVKQKINTKKSYRKERLDYLLND